MLVGLAGGGWKVEMDRRYVHRGQHSAGNLHFHANAEDIQEIGVAKEAPIQINVCYSTLGANALNISYILLRVNAAPLFHLSF